MCLVVNILLLKTCQRVDIKADCRGWFRLTLTEYPIYVKFS